MYSEATALLSATKQGFAMFRKGNADHNNVLPDRA
jgi:hypothetical protein